MNARNDLINKLSDVEIKLMLQLKDQTYCSTCDSSLVMTVANKSKMVSQVRLQFGKAAHPRILSTVCVVR